MQFAFILQRPWVFHFNPYRIILKELRWVVVLFPTIVEFFKNTHTYLTLNQFVLSPIYSKLCTRLKSIWKEL